MIVIIIREKLNREEGKKIDDNEPHKGDCI